MSDHAVEAAQRAEHAAWAFVDPPGAAKDIAERAAREALAPIRAEIEKLRALYDLGAERDRLVHHVLDRIAKHAYPKEELT